MKILIKIGILMIILGTIIQLYDMMKLNIIDKMKEQYCYNLPLTTFYQDHDCVKYKIKLSEVYIENKRLKDNERGDIR